MWAPAAKQLPSLGLDKVKQITAVYEQRTIMHVYQAPLVSILLGFDLWLMCNVHSVHSLFSFRQVMTIVCSSNANLGSIRSSALPKLSQVLAPLCVTLVNSLKPDDFDESSSPVVAYYQ